MKCTGKGKVNPEARGDQKLWALSQPFTYDGVTCEYIITSCAINETFIFPCDATGKVVSWGELPGSFQGEENHDEAIRRFCEGIVDRDIDYTVPADSPAAFLNPIMDLFKGYR